MKRIFSLLVMLSCVVVGVWAQGRMSAATRLALLHQYHSSSRIASANDQMVRAFITVDSPQAIDQLHKLGVKVHARFSNRVTASMPLSSVAQLCQVSGVRQLSVAQLAQVSNDSALADAHVPPLASGVGFGMSYDGRGVVIGVIDTGVDFNHINLCDATGRSRVVAAYLPQDSTGISPIIHGDTLPGSHYTTPEQIVRLTTDDPTASHGTHTTGTAAGSCINGMQGVAPQAQLVICAMPELWDTDIANSLLYIFDYADRVGLPAVVNMSFSSSDGPHDGTSPLCQIFDQLSGPGRILSVSAHNSGFAALHMTHNFKTMSDTLNTAIELYSSSFNSSLYLWSSEGHRHALALTLIDKTEKKIVAETPFLTDIAPDSLLTFEVDSDAVWSHYATGNFLFATAVEEGDRSHSVVISTIKPFDTSRYRLGLRVIADDDPDFNAWASGGAFFAKILDGQRKGTKAGTISDLATGDQAISVGAYIAKQTFPLATGGTYSNRRATPMHDIAYFTAWGPDVRGKARPDICAPGMVTISSASRYDTCSAIINTYNLSFIHHAQGVDYPYGACYGTSMSAPVMTGTIALWLQACPNLTPDDVRDILDHTAVRDEFVVGGDARQWGRGKLDAEAGMRYLLRRINSCDISGDGLVDVTDINIIINVMLGKDSTFKTEEVDANRDGQVDISDVNKVIDVMLGLKDDLSYTRTNVR